MTTKDVIRQNLISSLGLVKGLMGDLSDADLLVRPAPGANHIAWQLGHLAGAHASFLGTLTGTPGELPAGFRERHTKDTAAAEPPGGFLKKEEYVSILDRLTNELAAVLERMSDADLDKPNTSSTARLAPTLGLLLLLAGQHIYMHSGQITTVRRKLGKPVLF